MFSFKLFLQLIIYFALIFINIGSGLCSYSNDKYYAAGCNFASAIFVTALLFKIVIN